MTSSRYLWSAACGLALFFAPRGATAQEVDGDTRRIAADQYNRATETEREGFEDREHGGPGSALLRMCQRDCLIQALGSYHIMPSRLAAWRVVSCAAGTESWLIAQLAVEAFRSLEPAGIESWTHASIGETERARVLAAVEEARRRVGAVRLTVRSGAQVFWGQPAAPVELTPTQLPDYDADLHRGPLRTGPVRVGDLLFLPAGAHFSAVVDDGGVLQHIDMVVAPLASGGPATAESPSAEASPRQSTRPGSVSPTAEQAARTLEQLRPQLARCRTAGVATVSLDLRSDGTVGAVSIRPSVGGHALQRCLEDVVRRTRFPAPGPSGAHVVLPVDLGAEPAPPACRPNGALCRSAGECCGGLCRSSRCWSCVAPGQRCSRTNDHCCPATRCSATGTCQ